MCGCIVASLACVGGVVVLWWMLALGTFAFILWAARMGYLMAGVGPVIASDAVGSAAADVGTVRQVVLALVILTVVTGALLLPLVIFALRHHYGRSGRRYAAGMRMPLMR